MGTCGERTASIATCTGEYSCFPTAVVIVTTRLRHAGCSDGGSWGSATGPQSPHTCGRSRSRRATLYIASRWRRSIRSSPGCSYASDDTWCRGAILCFTGISGHSSTVIEHARQLDCPPQTVSHTPSSTWGNLSVCLRAGSSMGLCPFITILRWGRSSSFCTYTLCVHMR